MNISPCPLCKTNERVSPGEVLGSNSKKGAETLFHQTACNGCGLAGPQGKDETESVKLWNEAFGIDFQAGRYYGSVKTIFSEMRNHVSIRYPIMNMEKEGAQSGKRFITIPKMTVLAMPFVYHRGSGHAFCFQKLQNRTVPQMQYSISECPGHGVIMAEGSIYLNESAPVLMINISDLNSNNEILYLNIQHTNPDQENSTLIRRIL